MLMYNIIYCIILSCASRGESAPSSPRHTLQYIHIIIYYILYSAHSHTFGILYLSRSHLPVHALYIYSVMIITIIFYYNSVYVYYAHCSPHKRILYTLRGAAARRDALGFDPAARRRLRVSRRPRALDDFILPFVSHTHTHTPPSAVATAHPRPARGSFTSPPPPPPPPPSARDVWT